MVRVRLRGGRVNGNRVRRRYGKLITPAEKCYIFDSWNFRVAIVSHLSAAAAGNQDHSQRQYVWHSEDYDQGLGTRVRVSFWGVGLGPGVRLFRCHVWFYIICVLQIWNINASLRVRFSVTFRARKKWIRWPESPLKVLHGRVDDVKKCLRTCRSQTVHVCQLAVAEKCYIFDSCNVVVAVVSHWSAAAAGNQH